MRYQITNKENGIRTRYYIESGTAYAVHEEFFQATGWQRLWNPEQIPMEDYEEDGEDIEASWTASVEYWIGEHEYFVFGLSLESLRDRLLDAGFWEEDVNALLQEPLFIEQWNEINEEE